MTSPLYIDLHVPDVAAAARFYEQALEPEVVRADASGAVEMKLLAESHVVLRVIDEAQHPPSSADRRFYTKGKTPRLEIVTNDVDARVARLLSAGATARTLLVPGEDGVLRSRREGDGPTRYAQIKDPFGHLWAIAAADDEGPESA